MGLGTFISVLYSICLIIIFTTIFGSLFYITILYTFTHIVWPYHFRIFVSTVWYPLFYIAILVFGLTSMFLIMIFILWMIIKHIVPSWILFIPVRKICLKVPPFPELTKAGILPLMERIMNVFGGSGTLFNKLGISGQAVYSFLFKATRYVFQKLTPNYKPDKVSSTSRRAGIDPEKDPSDKPEYESKPPDDVEDDPDATPYYRKTILMIDNEKINCIRSKRKEIKPYFNTKELTSVHVHNATTATRCEAEAIVGYMKASFTRKL